MKLPRPLTLIAAALCLTVISACVSSSGTIEIELQPSQAYVEHYVTLSVSNASGSDYTWTLSERPTNSTATLNSDSTNSVKFTPDVDGSYSVALEGGDLSAPLVRTFNAKALPDNTERAARDVINGINEYRQQGYTCNKNKENEVYLGPTNELSEDGRLERAALKHSRDMKIYNYFAHKSQSDGSEVEDRVRNTGYRYSGVGENLARGASLAGNPSRLLDGWLTSDDNHCEILMNPNFTEIGVAVVDYEGIPYWTAVFAKPK